MSDAGEFPRLRQYSAGGNMTAGSLQTLTITAKFRCRVVRMGARIDPKITAYDAAFSTAGSFDYADPYVVFKDQILGIVVGEMAEVDGIELDVGDTISLKHSWSDQWTDDKGGIHFNLVVEELE